MPIFDYRCKRCDHVYEVLVRSVTEQIICPQCQCADDTQERRVSAPKLFKGLPTGKFGRR